MLHNDNKTAGFGTVGIVIVTLAVLVVAGVVGWRVWDASQQKSTASSSNASTTPATSTATAIQVDPNEGYVVIKEWGVRLKAVAGLTNLKTLSRTSSLQQAQEQMFMTDDMQKLNAACSGEAEGSRPLGALVRTQAPITQLSNLQSINQINGYYYYYYAPATSCSPDATNEALQTANLAKVKESLSTLEATK